MLLRLLKHLFLGPYRYLRYFGGSGLSKLEAAVVASEELHSAQLRLAIDPSMNLISVLRGVSPRERALELFGLLRVWDTQERSGVLVFIQLADGAIEIVADRGLNQRIPSARWEEACQSLKAAFSDRRYLGGVDEAIQEISKVLASEFPPKIGNINELPDRPILV